MSSWILGVGASAGPGLGARNIAMAARAGWHEIAPLPFERGAVLGVACARPPLDAPLRERLMAFAMSALKDAARHEAVRELGPLPLLLSLPEDDGAFDATFVDELVDACAGVDRRRVIVVRGEEAALASITTAVDWMDRDRLPAVIVGGADSLVERGVLARLVDEGRVVPCGWTPGSGHGGITPGEGAAFVVLSRTKPKKAEALAELTKAATKLASDDEPDPANSALASAAAPFASACVLSDANPEPDRMEAIALSLRELRATRKDLHVSHESISASLGETGVAAAFLAVATGASWLAVGATREDAVIVTGGLGTASVWTFVIEAAGSGFGPPAAVQHRETGLHGQVKTIASTALEWAKELGRAQGITPARRELIEARRREVSAIAHELAETVTEDLSTAAVDRLAAALQDLEKAVRSALKGTQRRSKTGARINPAKVMLEMLAEEAAEAAGLVRRERADVASSEGLPRAAVVADEAFMVSDGLPSPIALAHAPGRPRDPELVRAQDEDDEDEEDDEELGALEASKKSPDDPVESDVARGVEACLDAIGSGWRLRIPPPSVPWSPALVEVDRSMLAHLDWIHALLRDASELGEAPAASSIVGSLRAPDSPLDPARAFASTWVLACATDERLVRSAVMKASAAAPDLVRPYGDALALGGSRFIDGLLRELCLADDRPALELALEVMRRRRAPSIGAVTPLLYHDDAAIRRRAAAALGFATTVDAATSALESRLSSESSPLARAEIVVALLRLGAPFAEGHLNRAFADAMNAGDGEEERRARIELGVACAALGHDQEAIAFEAIARTPEEIEVVGWFGRATNVLRLVLRLEDQDADPEVKKSASRALTRILGTVVDRTRAAPKLVVGKLASVDEDELVLEPGLFRTFLSIEGSKLVPQKKYRFGRPFEPEMAQREIASRARQSDRAIAELELAICGAESTADVEGWVASHTSALGRPARRSA